jgi:hypothetical protein
MILQGFYLQRFVGRPDKSSTENRIHSKRIYLREVGEGR